jgi:hypothetical protein
MPFGQRSTAFAESIRLRTRHRALAATCARSVTDALEVCVRSVAFSDDRYTVPLHCAFYLRALVDGLPVLAVWRVATLAVHPALAERARILVELGEVFGAEERVTAVRAGLDTPLQAALTLLRAADEVLDFHMHLDELDVEYRTLTASPERRMGS